MMCALKDANLLHDLLHTAAASCTLRVLPPVVLCSIW